MNGNGVLLTPPKPASDSAQITFYFTESGDLARIEGTVNMQQLLLIAFECTQLAAGVRSRMAMQAAQSQAEIAGVAAQLAKEGKHGGK